VVVTQDATRDRVPQEAYDEIYAATEIEKLTTRIRDQDPEGIVRPFLKPPPRDAKRPRDTTK